MSFLVVLTTTPDKKSARKIADILIQKKLAACVSLGPGWQSVYRWKGRTGKTREVLLLIKTSRARLKTLQKTLIQNHPYDVPEVLVLQASAPHSAYAAWLRDSLK